MIEQTGSGADEADAPPAVDDFEQIVQAIGTGVYCLDVGGNMTYINPTAEALLGFPRQALLGVAMHTMIHHTQPNGRPHPKERCSISLTLGDGMTRRVQNDRFWRADGTSFPVEYISTALRRGAVVVGAVITFQDLSERRRAEAARIKAEVADKARLQAEAQEAIRSRDAFLSIAAHELRTPVTALRGFAQLALRRLKRGTFDLARGRAVLEEIDEQTTHLTNLVNQLLDVSRLDVGAFTIDRAMMDVASVVEASVHAVRATTETHVITIQSPESLPAFLDAARIEQILVHVLGNLIKFSPDGGRIDIAVASPLPNTAQIIVRDHGAGIPAEQQVRIFDRFAEIHTGDQYWSVGLGLYLSRQIAELHGGTLAVDSPPGGGTRFTLLLPLRHEAGGDGPAFLLRRPSAPDPAHVTPNARHRLDAAPKAG